MKLFDPFEMTFYNVSALKLLQHYIYERNIWRIVIYDMIRFSDLIHSFKLIIYYCRILN